LRLDVPFWHETFFYGKYSRYSRPGQMPPGLIPPVKALQEGYDGGFLVT
jgi:hypothetical protein